MPVLNGFADAALRGKDRFGVDLIAGRRSAHGGGRAPAELTVDLASIERDPNARKPIARPLGDPARKDGSPEGRLLRQERFLVAFVKIGTVSGAARKAGISTGTHNNWLDTDAVYAAAFKEAFEAAVDRAEEALIKRGVDGVRKPVFYQGEKVAEITEYSDSNLQFYLRGRRSSVYREKTEISGPDGGPIAMAILAKLAQGRARVAGQRLIGGPNGTTNK